MELKPLQRIKLVEILAKLKHIVLMVNKLAGISEHKLILMANVIIKFVEQKYLVG